MLRLGGLLFCFGSFVLNGQIHNRLTKINFGVSYEQFIHKSTILGINDTSAHEFELVTTMPTFSYSHEFVLNDVISLGGKAGFQYMNIFYDNQHYGSPYLYLSVNPVVSLFYRRGFEFYVKLQAGVSFWFNKPELLTETTKRFFPDHVNLFTGVTFGGFNFFVSDHIGLNLELSIWSPEMVSFGITYRYWKGELPKIQETQEL